MASDFDSLRGHPGPDGYRFADSIEIGSGGAARIQIVDRDGVEIGWAAVSQPAIRIEDATRKTAANEARRHT